MRQGKNISHHSYYNVPSQGFHTQILLCQTTSKRWSLQQALYIRLQPHLPICYHVMTTLLNPVTIGYIRVSF